MNTIIEVIPLVGIKWWDNQIINLLDSKQVVENILGKPYSIWENSYYYHKNQLRFDFNEIDTIEFIEFLGGIDGDIQPQIYGVNAFEIKANDLYYILKSQNNGNIDDNGTGYSYGFINISVGIYRPTKPEDVQEMIKEAEKDNVKIDLKYETRYAAHWHTIGIGITGYYR